MPNDIDKQIRLALKGLIQLDYPTAVIWPYNALSHDLREWPGLFRTSDGKTHGWIIKQTSLAATRKNNVLDRRTLPFDLWAFYGFRQGTESDNSDNEFGQIRDKAYEAVKASPNLGIEGTVEYHDLLQFLNITTLETGEETLHFAHGQLTVHLCC